MFFSALQVPNAQRVVLGRRDRTASVRRDDDPVHRIAVAFERCGRFGRSPGPKPGQGKLRAGFTRSGPHVEAWK